MRRHEHAGPMALRAMQELATRTFPATGYRHIGDLTWNWCLSLDRGLDRGRPNPGMGLA
ncbi:hypothetical protein [Streptomyces sp. NPDC001502]|uniref:hypothetical protein n=1 Tax=Streptomyces sp. NPDC001502 TaxID=3364578 RepID=UPI0036AE0760